MATLFAIPSGGAEDWRRVLGDPERHWRDGFSAKSTAVSWESARGLPPEMALALGGNPELLLAIPEHKVAIPGRGGDSQCDVFALVRRAEDLVAVSVEAKVAEPFGQTVDEWLSKGGDNRRQRLEALVDLLECDPPHGALRYQLFHRTAAAILEARRFMAAEAAMLVQSFSPTHQWKDDFEAFADHLGARPLCRLRDGLCLRLEWVQSPLP